MVLIGLYFVDFPNPRSASYDHSIGHVLGQASRFVTLSIGPAARLAVAVERLPRARAHRDHGHHARADVHARPTERVRIAGIFAMAGGIVSMAIATGSRAEASATSRLRGTLRDAASPYLCCIFSRGCCTDRRRSGGWCASCCIPSASACSATTSTTASTWATCA